MGPATGQAGDCSPDLSCPRKLKFAVRAFVEKSPDALLDEERKIVAALFITDAEIAAGAAPLQPVRQDPFPAGPKLSQKMREFMSKCSVDFFRAMPNQQRV